MEPFVKWVGGKRQLLLDICERLPNKFRRYYEVFAGGGALYFYLTPQHALLNDKNAELINTYRWVRDEPYGLMALLQEYDKQNCSDKSTFYYKARNAFNDKLKKQECSLEQAALFIFLNKHCFNGVYRVNRNGLFNVSYNSSLADSYSEDNILRVSKQLKDVDLRCKDFREICRLPGQGDFVFLDSPYAPLSGGSFTRYTQSGFSVGDHSDLAQCFRDMSNRGCFCMATNHNTAFVRDLYKDYRIEVVSAKRSVNQDGSNRTGEELIITNY